MKQWNELLSHSKNEMGLENGNNMLVMNKPAYDGKKLSAYGIFKRVC